MTPRQSLLNILVAEFSIRERECPGRYSEADAYDQRVVDIVEHVAANTKHRPDWREYYLNASDRAYRNLVIAVMREVRDRNNLRALVSEARLCHE